jgi:ketosteroid isomerase-like protein
MRSWFVVLCSLSAAPVVAQQPPAVTPPPSVTLPPELDRVLRDYEKGWSGRDAAGLAALFTEDGFVLQGNRQPVRGRDAITRAYTGLGGPLVLRAMAYAADDTVGYIIGGYRGSQGAADDGKFILALRKQNGRWMIAADIDNSNHPRR